MVGSLKFLNSYFWRSVSDLYILVCKIAEPYFERWFERLGCSKRMRKTYGQIGYDARNVWPCVVGRANQKGHISSRRLGCHWLLQIQKSWLWRKTSKFTTVHFMFREKASLCTVNIITCNVGHFICPSYPLRHVKSVVINQNILPK